MRDDVEQNVIILSNNLKLFENYRDARLVPIEFLTTTKDHSILTVTISHHSFKKDDIIAIQRPDSKLCKYQGAVITVLSKDVFHVDCNIIQTDTELYVNGEFCATLIGHPSAEYE